MLRSLHTICLALLLQSLATGEPRIVSITRAESFSSARGKQCYDCTVVSGSKDQCGNFDQWTPKCNVASDGDCLKSTIQGSVFLNLTRLFKFIFTFYNSHVYILYFSPGQEIVVHSCDVLPVCPGQRDECLQENGNSVCCCHGDL